MSRGVVSEGSNSSSCPEVASDTSMPFGSFALLCRAILFRILCTSVVLPFVFKYLGDSGARLYKSSTANEGIEDNAGSHLQFNAIITICTRNNNLILISLNVLNILNFFVYSLALVTYIPMRVRLQRLIQVYRK